MEPRNVNRIRRASIAFSVVVYCLLVATYAGLQKEALPLGEELIRQLLDVAQTALMFYLGASAIDSSNIAQVLNARFGRNSGYGGYGDYGSSYETHSYGNSPPRQYTPEEEEELFPAKPSRKGKTK